MTTMKHKVGGQCERPECGLAHYGRGLCKKHHQLRWKRGELPLQPVSLKEKIEAYSLPVPEAGCWLWIRNVNNKGYGRISIGNQKQAYAHRVSYEVFNGPIAPGLEVCHRCDTPACVNPDHLFLADHWQNMEDASRKGRMRTNPLHGSEHQNSKLTDEQVIAIRTSRRPATYWARLLGINAQTVRRARAGLSYRTVPFHAEFGSDDELMRKQNQLIALSTTRAA